MGKFVHLHLHSEYSLLDGACRLRDLPARVKECGHDAVALTDHGVLYGAVAFDQACRSAGIHPIIGCEVYVAPGSRFDKQTGRDHAYTHLVLLCETTEGYRNLMTMVSLGFTEGFYSRPRVDRELLRRYHTGLIALSACLSGDIPRKLLAGDFEGATAAAQEFSSIFGKDHFYIELQNHGLPEEKQILPSLFRLARSLDLPLVATNDCHYLRKKDAAIQEILTCIQTNRTVGDGHRVGFGTDEFYYKTTEEMTALFGNYPDAIENTVRIAERCHVEFDFNVFHLPKFPCPDGEAAGSYLARLTEEGFVRRVKNGEIVFYTDDEHPGRTEKDYRDRLNYELSVIAGMGYDDYFLIVQDYVNFAKNHDIPVGPGRGSGAGSLVAYCIGITEVDSIAFDLLFERFLNPERVSMPDIDVDFCYNRRDEVIEYVAARYGRDHVSQIITFGTLAARAAIRDVGRAMGMSYADVDVVARAVPHELGITIADALKLPDLKTLYEDSEQVRKLVDTALALEGMPRNASIHAAGIVITDRPVSEYVPLAVCNGTIVTQYDMDTVAKLGILKFDFLALRYLTIMHDAEQQVRETDPAFRLDHVPTDDHDTYELIGKGTTTGIFQLESGGMRQMLTSLKPQGIEDIEAAIALYRPGPMEAIPTYIAYRKDPSQIKYASPLLEPILKSTYGVTVYQEQVMSIFRVLAGYTYGHADIVRRAMSKKKASVLEAERGSFVEGASHNGLTEDEANQLFDDMGSFANYAFNKSHAAAYALISYRTAYLKTHHPGAYFAALLTSVLGNQPKMAEYTAECEKYGISVLPPDINESYMNFHASGNGRGGSIRYGLLALKNVGESFLRAILTERQARPFTSFEDFLDRMTGHDLNKRQVEALIKAGAFDSFPTYRSQLLAVYESMIETRAAKSRANLEGQMDMFSMGESSDHQDDTAAVVYPDIPPFTLRERLMLEKEASGMFFSGELLDDYSQCIASLHPRPISELLPSGSDDDAGDSPDLGDMADRPEITNNMRVSIVGIVTAVSVKTTRKDERMAFFTLEDSDGEIECLAFPKVFLQNSADIRTDNALYVEGKVSIREDNSVSILVSLLSPLVDNAHFAEQKQKTEAQKNPTPAETTPQSPAAHSIPERPAAPALQRFYNPYEFMPQTEATKEDLAAQAERKAAAPVQSAPPVRHAEPAPPIHTPVVSKVYLRVPDLTGEPYLKAQNLAQIFCDGRVEVIFYDESTRKYMGSNLRMSWTPFIESRMKRILGDGNVATR